MVFPVVGGDGKPTGYEIENSLRFNPGDSPKLERTVGTPTNEKIYTISIWVKKGTVGDSNYILGTPPEGDRLSLGDNVEFITNGSANAYLRTNRKTRDVAAWYHIVIAYDTTQGTAANRVKLYINGEQYTWDLSTTYPSQNTTNGKFNKSGSTAQIGTGHGGDYGNGYFSELHFIDGQALAPTSFGEYDSDSPTIWKPIDVSGLTPGTNGTYLDFEDSANLGNDAFGGTDWTEVGLDATHQMTDSPTNNFPVINALFFGSGLGGNDSVSITRGNLVAHDYSGIFVPCTMFVNKGKWYWENKIGSQTDAKYTSMGIASESVVASSDMQDDGTAGGHSLFGGDDLAYSYYGNNGYSLDNDSTQAYGDTYAANDIIGVALDLDNNKLYFSKNGTWQNSGDPESGATGTGAISITNTYYTPMTGGFSGDSDNSNYNFGGGTTWAVSSANADANDGGTTFEYAPPSGYFAICTKNLAEYGYGF